MDTESARALAEEGLEDGGHCVENGGLLGGGSPKRRSGRSIKRKKFDDELVDSMSTSYPKPLKPPPTEQELLDGLAAGGGIEATQDEPFYPEDGSFTFTLHNRPSMMQAAVIAGLQTSLTPVNATPLPPSLASASSTSTAPLLPTPSTSSYFVVQRKKKSGSGKGTDFVPQQQHFQQIQATREETNYWKPADDLALIINVEQTNDLVKVHQGVQFSVKFSLADIEARWYALLYDVHTKSLSLAAIRQLHSDVISAVQSRALYSDAEEALLKQIESRSEPSVDVFQRLLDDNPGDFLATRTAKLLRKQWGLMRQYQLLADQTLQPLPRHESVVSFAEIERTVEQELMDENRLRMQQNQQASFNFGSSATTITASLASPSTTSHHHHQQANHHHHLPTQSPGVPGQPIPFHNQQNSEAAGQEILSSIRKSMLEIRMLENEIPKYQCLLDSITGITQPSDFNQNTYAVLRGRLVRYLMRSMEVTIGRSTKDFLVDVDLSLEGPASKISRIQAIIKLAPTGEFSLFNAGKRLIYVDGRPLLTESSVRVYHNSLLDFSTLKFVFLVNQDLVASMRHEELLKV